MPKNTLWRDDYQPLRVVAHMAGPIGMLPHDALPLDGILEYAAFQLRYPPVLQYTDANGRRHLPRVTDRDPANFVLPLKRHGHKLSPDWYWHASWAEFPHGFETDRAHWNKRFDGGRPEVGKHLNFGGRRGSINLASGRYKSYHMPLSLLVAPTVQWWCFGAPDGILALLRTITHLGHKRSQGLGEVARWSVYLARGDRSCWWQGRPMRAMPDVPGDYRREHHGVRPPYWHQSRRRLLVVPDARLNAGPHSECSHEKIEVEREHRGAEAVRRGCRKAEAQEEG